MARGKSLQVVPGQKIGELTLLRHVGVVLVRGTPHEAWEFRCSCGASFVASISEVWHGRKLTCGCGRVKGIRAAVAAITKTGASRSWLYSRYYSMRATAREDNLTIAWDNFDSFYAWFTAMYPDIDVFDKEYAKLGAFARVSSGLGFTPSNLLFYVRKAKNREGDNDDS